jgi:hypothetical protein
MTRTTVNYGGIWANVFEEVIYYSGAVDDTGADLKADGSYTLTFPADDLPSKYAKYFWSVIAIDRLHRRVLPNPLNRFLLNKESKLTYGSDGSLTLYFAPEKPADAPEGNGLPTKGKPWKLTFRFYGPRAGVAGGSYFPPPAPAAVTRSRSCGKSSQRGGTAKARCHPASRRQNCVRCPL